MSIRRAAVAGSFYPGDKDALLRQLKDCFTHALGPGRLPTYKSGKRAIKGCVVPHAGYVYSGPVASWVYNELANDGFPEMFVILGPNHSGIGSVVALTMDIYSTPLGEVPTAQDVASRMLGGIIDDDARAHSAEHSIEVQLPFLQFIERDIKCVPITMGLQDHKTAMEVGHAIAEAIKDADAVIIASSDFTHCGFMYGQMPPAGMRAHEFAKAQDEQAIAAILGLDPEALVDTVKERHITMCGYGCVAAMLHAVNAKEAHTARLLKYATSYDISPGDIAVGYGAIVIE